MISTPSPPPRDLQVHTFTLGERRRAAKGWKSRFNSAASIRNPLQVVHAAARGAK